MFTKQLDDPNYSFHINLESSNEIETKRLKQNNM